MEEKPRSPTFVEPAVRTQSPEQFDELIGNMAEAQLEELRAKIEEEANVIKEQLDKAKESYRDGGRRASDEWWRRANNAIRIKRRQLAAIDEALDGDLFDFLEAFYDVAVGTLDGDTIKSMETKARLKLSK